ncbi:MAG TPA: hypothetical protein VFU21_07850, partial [Kofleriaceae bacterium]|nr:hypothetical protein [Kofleriaceae bacterium]
MPINQRAFLAGFLAAMQEEEPVVAPVDPTTKQPGPAQPVSEAAAQQAPGQRGAPGFVDTGMAELTVREPQIQQAAGQARADATAQRQAEQQRQMTAILRGLADAGVSLAGTPFQPQPPAQPQPRSTMLGQRREDDAVQANGFPIAAPVNPATGAPDYGAPLPAQTPQQQSQPLPTPNVQQAAAGVGPDPGAPVARSGTDGPVLEAHRRYNRQTGEWYTDYGLTPNTPLTPMGLSADWIRALPPELQERYGGRLGWFLTNVLLDENGVRRSQAEWTAADWAEYDALMEDVIGPLNAELLNLTAHPSDSYQQNTTLIDEASANTQDPLVAGLGSGLELADKPRQAIVTGGADLAYRKYVLGEDLSFWEEQQLNTFEALTGVADQAGVMLTPGNGWMGRTFSFWLAEQDPALVTRLYTAGYDANEDGVADFTGARALWEAHMADKNWVQRMLVDSFTDPLSYTPVAAKALKGAGAFLEGAGAGRLGRGVGALGHGLQLTDDAAGALVG